MQKFRNSWYILIETSYKYIKNISSYLFKYTLKVWKYFGLPINLVNIFKENKTGLD